MQPEILIALLFLCAFLLAMLVFLSLGSTFFIGAPWTPSRKEVIAKALSFANLKKGKTFYDLGSGDGRVVFEAAKIGAEAYGFEINPFLFLYSKISSFFNGGKIIFADMLSVDVSRADAVFCYLLPSAMQALNKKFFSMKKGAILISYQYKLPGLKEWKKDERLKIYAYEVSGKAYEL